MTKRHTPPERRSRFYRFSERGFDRIIAFYGRTLRFVLDYQGATLLVAVAVMILTVLLYMMVPKGFFPTQDTGIIQGISQAAASISFTSMSERQQALGADVDAGEMKGRVDHGRDVARLRPEDQQQRLLDHKRDRKRDQQHGQHGAPQRTNQHPLDDDAERADQWHRQEAGEPQRQVRVRRETVDEVGAERVEGAVRQIENPRHAEDEGEPHRQHGVDRADYGAIDDDLDQGRSGGQF